MRNAFLLVMSPCSPYAKDHRVKGKSKWQLFQKKAVQFTPLSRAHKVQLSLQVSLLAKISETEGDKHVGLQTLKQWMTGSAQPHHLCCWWLLARQEQKHRCGLGGDARSAVTDWDWPYPASIRGCQLAGSVRSGLPSLSRGCINGN